MKRLEDEKKKREERAEKLEKETYVPPEVIFVELDVEEALMAICSTGSGTVPMPVCQACFSPS
jgi:hypothetical protein